MRSYDLAGWTGPTPIDPAPPLFGGPSTGPSVGSALPRASGEANIRWLQTTLNRVANAGLSVDGIAGQATRAAVRAFQSANGLTADGVAGPLTMAALRAALERGGGLDSGATPVCTGLPERQIIDGFAFGQARIEPHMQPRIDGIAACLLASLDTATPIDGLSVIGHTDPVGDDLANLGLGQRRAEAIVEAIDASLRRQGSTRRFSFVFTPSSRGEIEQVPGDPARNRRVEVVAPFAFPPAPIPDRRRQPPPDRRHPPFRSELEPPRWGPILARAIGPRAIMRTGNAVRHLIDAENPAAPALAGYNAMIEAIRSARGGSAFIYLLGWICVDDFDMITCDPASKLSVLLADAASRGVQVRGVFWEASRLLAANRRKTQASADHINALAGGAAIIDGETLSLGAHHQKLLVVSSGEALVGFTGGLDVNPDRILPTTIVCTMPVAAPRRADAGEADHATDDLGHRYGEFDESMSGGGGEPLHDVHCRVEGPAAFDLLGTFITRWDHHPDSRAIEARMPLRGRATSVPAPFAAPVPATRSSTGDTCSVVVGRTFNPRRGSGMPRERDIKSMLLAAIGNARRFIYMEDQYLLNLDAARALRAALPNIQHLTIVIAATDINSDTPCIWTYRREFVTALTRGLPPGDASKVRIFQLVTPPVPTIAPPCSTRRRVFSPTFGRHTYVHAKCWVFDDELAVIGSANCNKRGWEHDTEIDAFVFDDRIPVAATTRTFAQQMRMDLWAEHLTLPVARLVDGIASAAHWLRPPVTAHILPYCPDDDDDIATFKCGALKDTVVDPPAP
jgi:phosphatidylserine/phosphatidylglycerophosphate/cardiolipin synthase-like enzyme/outer membrane protein OmpA-like peptidoglycan-associated protein